MYYVFIKQPNKITLYTDDGFVFIKLPCFWSDSGLECDEEQWEFNPERISTE